MPRTCLGDVRSEELLEVTSGMASRCSSRRSAFPRSDSSLISVIPCKASRFDSLCDASIRAVYFTIGERGSYRRGDDRLFPPLPVVDGGSAAHDDLAAPGPVGFHDAVPTHDDAPVGIIGSG
jgi:hypothetical protein